MEYLENLNNSQRAAVEYTEGPLLVLAGAGTGKTKVLTSRIAHIINSGRANVDEILAITFTNKAASEMLSRIKGILGNIFIPWVGTFHSISTQILRKHYDGPSFGIIDSDDQLSIVKKVISEHGIDSQRYSPKLLLSLISKQKDKCLNYDQIPASEAFAGIQLSILYRNYQNKLKSLNVMDFGDLLMESYFLIKENAALREYYQSKFKYLLIDEYQDTNVAQYLWSMLLAQKHRNICCVGDDDQSIYGWRGAEVENILRFESDFKDAKVIKLQQNYRSLSPILKVASAIISNNQDRHDKELWTQNSEIIPVILHIYIDDRQEARKIADEINVYKSNGIRLSEIAILVRAGYQTRLFEEALNYLCVPYKIIGGAKFYERAEVKNAIAYMRLLVNDNDNLAFLRVINTPKRGVGDSSIAQLTRLSEQSGLSMMKVLKTADLKPKLRASTMEFISTFEDCRAIMNEDPVKAVERLFLQLGFKEYLEKYDAENMTEKAQNVNEVLKSLSSHDSIIGYLEHVSLLSDVDSLSTDEKVNIITMHSAKGLEFEVVFLPGWEEGVFPTSRAMFESKQLSEERRLAYVAVTRAKRYLQISYARSRMVFGNIQTSLPSRFLEEIPKNCCKTVDEIDIYRAANSGFRKNNLTYGDIVTHGKFGEGKVIGSGARGSIYVEFDLIGIKEIAADEF
ncbi:DNA helicase II [Candidatus Cyrtobacter comes]|uniref:DNA 3'-5' helicase n=1 Tax=Candidatus Cyrtobacter comes TaxID=675776 RepID=A0ABU5L7H7_9RICK|nr:UvrD-helicase domain-containing protein [Candidatus Cyrtobacter comes]MDZ5762079.1 DNA helicase II [Candidatus Cyrtobacter comes]